jgi:hypothetical protein
METKIQTGLAELSHEEILQLDRDYMEAAKKAKLRYVNDGIPGISRVKKGTGFGYYYKDKQLRDEEQLTRIKKLAIPPAWTRVWICPYENGHIQATVSVSRTVEPRAKRNQVSSLIRVWKGVASITSAHREGPYQKRLEPATRFSHYY